MRRLLPTWLGLRIENRAPADLSPTELDAVWAFCSTMIERERSEFERTLARCERVFLVRRRRSNEVVGLATSQCWRGEVDGRAALVLEAKWAWLAKEVRGIHLPPVLTVLALLDARRRHPRAELYGMITAATEQSFVMIHRYARRAWPHPDRPTPPALAALVDGALSHHVPETWDREAGVVRGRGAYRYRIPQRRPRRDPEVERLAAFYHEKNPGQADGDCLPVILPLDGPTLLGFAWRAAGGGRRPRRAPASAARTGSAAR